SVDLVPDRREHGFDEGANFFDVLVVPHHVALEVDEELVLLGMIREAPFERHAQQVVAQSHRVGQKYTFIHDSRLAADDRLELHPGQDVAPDVDAGSNLDQLQAVGGKLEHAAFRDVEDGLAAFCRILTGNRPVLDVEDELLQLAVLDDAQAAVLDPDLEAAGRKGADEHHLLGVLADVDEAAGAGKARAELADVEIAVLVRLGETEKGRVEAAAVVEVELIGLIDDGLCIDRSAEIEPARRYPADDPGLGRPRHQAGDLFLIGDVGDALGHADAEIDDAVGIELERRAPRNDLALVQLHRRDRPRACANLTAERRIVLDREGLPVVLRLRHDNAV